MRLAVLPLMAAAASCDVFLGVEVEETQLRLTAEPAAAAVGDSVEIGFEAEGARLLEVVVDYGDGASQSFPLTGSQTASGSALHVYGEPGTYTVSGVLTDGTSRATDRIAVEVVPVGT